MNGRETDFDSDMSAVIVPPVMALVSDALRECVISFVLDADGSSESEGDAVGVGLELGDSVSEEDGVYVSVVVRWGSVCDVDTVNVSLKFMVTVGALRVAVSEEDTDDDSEDVG